MNTYEQFFINIIVLYLDRLTAQWQQSTCSPDDKTHPDWSGSF